VEALEDLTAGRSRTAVTCVEVQGTCIEYATCEWFSRFSLKTTGSIVFGFGPQT
jgi:hypothetical protein